MMLAFKFQHDKYSDEQLNRSITDVLEHGRLLSMSTVRPDGSAHINTAFYSFDSSLRLFIITDPKTGHGTNLASNPSVAVAIFNSHQEFWTPLRGLQLFGTCRQTPLLQIPHALSSFVKRFPVFSELVKSPADLASKTLAIRFHTIDVKRLKLFDEPTFGEEVFIDLKVRSG